MLMAKMDDGRLISLIPPAYTLTELQTLRASRRFYCPVCRSPVILKLGRKKKWHFAHHTDEACLIETEPETPGHVTGKADLYLWAGRHGRAPKLERYFPDLRQRPDVYLPGIHPTAFEYQCSTIPEETFIRRTLGYLSQGIDPAWILGSTRRKRWGAFTRLTGFEPMTIRYAMTSPAGAYPFSSSYYVCYYDPNEKVFSFAAHLHAASETLFIAQEISHSLRNIRPFQVVTPTFPFFSDTFKQKWLARKKQQRLAPSIRCGDTEYLIRTLAYRMRLDFSYYPAFVGLPHEDYIHLQTPPYLWQMWVYFMIRSLSGCFSAKTLIHLYLCFCRQNHHARKLFSMRRLPLCPKRSLGQLIETYLNQLVLLGAVKKAGGAYRASATFNHRLPIDELLKEDRRMLERLERPM
ncbi:competence protein [Sporolactobacillus sp. THM7-7]|nr:competence protein [Sporolactobacillus sp. THM7-7]